ncbi:MAG TPA: DNA methyltransferase [Terriglobia bacterium]|nr:DNA methyltransferase [Terriglobia bacterium]
MATLDFALDHSTRQSIREDNKLRAEDHAAHDWYRFVLSFPPHLVRDYIDKFGADSNTRVLDPFCGTGTTLVECKKLGIPSVGIEAHPLARFVSQVKVNWTVSPDALLKHAMEVAQLTSAKLEAEGIEDSEPTMFHNKNAAEVRLRTLPAHMLKMLLKDSISPLPLHKTLALLETLDEHKDSTLWRHERLALAKALVFKVSNLNFGPEVGVGHPKLDAPVLAEWVKGIRTMSDDLRHLQRENGTKANIYLADSRSPADVLKPKSVDFVITSPPYPNEKDYTRTTRLETVLLGLIQNKQEMRSLKKTMVRSNTRGVYKSDQDDLLVARNEKINCIADAIEKRRIELGKTSGFERLYARVTKLYFGGMARHLSELRPLLRPGAQLAYVLGDQASYLRVMIRTGQLLAEIATSLGYEITGIDLFRTRLATATKEQLREEVVLLRWGGVARKSVYYEKGANLRFDN